MRTTLLFLAIVLIGACTQVNKPMTAADKEKIVGEAKGLISTIIQSCEKAESGRLKSLFVNSSDFVSLVGGKYAEYEQSLKNVDGYFSMVVSQKSTIRSEKYIVLDPTTVLYTADSRWEARLKNDSTMIMDPTGMQFLLKKVDNQWKVLSWTEEVISK